MKKILTIDSLIQQAKKFSLSESKSKEPSLYRVTDGKAVGTYIEHKFIHYLESNYIFDKGNSASGIDLPNLNVDIKTTKISQPQSSCPYKSAEQKIYGLGYHLLVFVYDKIDDESSKTATLDIRHTIFIDKGRTGDYVTTVGIKKLLDLNANEDDLTAFIIERNLPVDEIGARELAKKILQQPPKIGYLTISNALQWRLQYKRAIEIANKVDGVIKVV